MIEYVEKKVGKGVYEWGKLAFVSPFYYELQVKQSVTIFGHKKKDRVFGMKLVVKKSIKYNKKQDVRNNMLSGVRNDVFL